MSGQQVQVRLRQMGVLLRFPRWSEEESERLRNEYTQHRHCGTLDVLASEMGRTKHLICRKARQLGLTDQRGPSLWNRVWKGLAEDEARIHFERFRDSKLGLGQYCQKKGFDDLGFSRCMQEHFPDEWDALIESKAPRQTKYRLGRQCEYRVRDDLRRRGYFVLRSPRSSGPVDLVAIKRGAILFVQCKRGMLCAVVEWNALFDLAETVAATPVLAGSPTGNGISYRRMVGRKDGSKRRQPMAPFDP